MKGWNKMSRCKVKIIEMENELKIVMLDEKQGFDMAFSEDQKRIISVTAEATIKELFIQDGEDIIIGDQFKPWTFSKLNKDRWEATHPSYGTKKIFSYKNYLMATTAGSARNGIFHNEKIAKNTFDEIMNKYSKYMKITIRIKPNLDGVYSFGGRWCDHVSSEAKCWNYTYSNGIHNPIVLSKDTESDNIYHRDCYFGFIAEPIKDATVCVTTQQYANPYFMNVIISAISKDELNNNKQLLVEAFENSFDVKLILGIEGFEKFKYAILDAKF